MSKKYVRLFVVATVVVVGGFFGLSFLTSRTNADSSSWLFGDDPDLPSQFQTGMSKEEFMLKRSEAIAALRGVEKDKPFDPTKRIEAIRQMEQQQARLVKRPASPEKDSLLAAWTEIGPNPIPNGQVISGPQLAVSGRTVAIAVHPTNANIAYVGTAQGGLYRTTDGGTTWTPLLDNALSLAVNTVAIAPSQPDTIFVGTGEAGFSIDSFFGVGIYRIDNASTATPTVTGPLNKNALGADVFTGRVIGKIVVHPTDPNIIFASSNSGIGGIGSTQNNVLPDRGLFRSTNALAANPIFEQLTIAGLATQNRNIVDVVMDPGNPDLVLCTELDSFNLGEGGVYRTTNALAPAPTFTRTFVAGGGTALSRTELALHRSGGGVVTVYAASATLGGTVQLSTDGGATWTQQISNNFCGGQCFYNIAVAVDPTNANRVYLGGTGTTTTFAFSTDAGVTFTNSQDGLHTDSHVIAVAPSLSSTIYFGSDGGIYKSTDSGATWATLNNATFRATQFISVALHPIDPNFSIGGTQDNGTNFYQPAATWTRADFGDGGYSLIDQSALDTTNVNMYHTYFNNSTLQGYGFVPTTATATEGNWVFRGCSGVAGNGIPCGGAVLFYAPLEQGPGTPNTIYYGANILYRSSDTGLNHTAVSQDLATPISAIGISPQNDNVRIVGQANGGLFGTSTGSSVLSDLDPSNTVPNNFIARVVIDPNNSTTAYATLSVFGVASTVWKTTTLSSAPTAPTWTAASGSGGTALPSVPVNAFIVDPANSNILYAGTDIGVYISQNGGGSWSPFGAGLPRVAVFDMALQNPNRILRIATHGRGMWQITPLAPTAAPATISGRVTTPDGSPLGGAVVRLSGAASRTTISDSAGNYRFENVATDRFYTVTPSLRNYQFGPASRSFSLLANVTDAVFTATRDTVISGNAIDTPEYFVRQHYLDFLGREPDESGFNFWSDQILSCGADASCIERRTINVSAAYFLSIEFRETGGIVDGLYRASYSRRPQYAEFMPDTRVVARDVVVGRADWAQTLEANKQAFIAAWVERAAFRAAYDGLGNSAYVDTLISRAQGFNGDRDGLVNGLNNGSLTRAVVLRAIVENEGFVNARRNEAFVMMQYFGYLRRDPDESGYQFWLNKL
ncbi:MAG: carboxypeptidase regulatory-like domain-containing protein, partial [Pyrinomonadaceae bacterium]